MKAVEPKLATRHLLWFAHYGPNPRPLPSRTWTNPACKQRRRALGERLRNGRKIVDPIGFMGGCLPRCLLRSGLRRGRALPDLRSLCRRRLVWGRCPRRRAPRAHAACGELQRVNSLPRKFVRIDEFLARMAGDGRRNGSCTDTRRMCRLTHSAGKVQGGVQSIRGGVTARCMSRTRTATASGSSNRNASG